jgi:hypothetical protein
MAGKLVNVIPKTAFDFSNIDSALTAEFHRIGDVIDVTDFGMLGLVVRVHDVSMAGTNNIFVGVFDDGFLDGSGFSFQGQLGWYGIGCNIYSTPTPSHALFSNGIVYGEHVAIAIQGVNGGLGGANSATLSIDAYLRNADET